MKKVLYICFVLLISGLASADPTGRLRGKIVDTSGNPIPKVTIKIEFQGEMTQVYTATTNDKGEFVHIGIRPGKYRLTPAKEGFRPVEFAYYDVEVHPSDKPVVVDMKMEPVPQAAAQGSTSGNQQQQAADAAAAAQTEERNKAVGLLNEGKVNEAVASLEKIVEADPTNATMQYNLGIAYERRDQYEKARQRYEEAIKLKPDFGPAFLSIGNSFMAQKNYTDAITPLTKAVELLPQSYEAAYNLGACYSNSGNYAEAEGAYKKAIAINPKDPVVHQQLGMALLGQSKKEEAKLEFQKYLELNPNAADKADILELIKDM
jgi:Flp pilus assembly protein TadD